MKKTKRTTPMHFTYVELKNWRNFSSVEVKLPLRVFLVGPNASGKSNLLDAFRFLRALVSVGCGFQPLLEKLGRPLVFRFLIEQYPACRARSRVCP